MGSGEIGALGELDAWSMSLSRGLPSLLPIGGAAEDEGLGVAAGVRGTGLEQDHDVWYTGGFRDHVQFGDAAASAIAGGSDILLARASGCEIVQCHIVSSEAEAAGGSVRKSTRSYPSARPEVVVTISEPGEWHVEIVDMLGRTTRLHSGPLPSGDATFVVPVTLAAGSYLVRALGATEARAVLMVVR